MILIVCGMDIQIGPLGEQISVFLAFEIFYGMILIILESNSVEYQLLFLESYVVSLDTLCHSQIELSSWEIDAACKAEDIRSAANS